MVSSRSSPGSSSTTRMRALRLPVWFKSGSWGLRVRRGGAGLALVQRTLDVGDRIELGARLLQLLAQPAVLLDLGLQTPVGACQARLVLARRIGLQPAIFRDQRQMVVNLRKLEEGEGALGGQQRLRMRRELAQQPLGARLVGGRVPGGGEH